MHPMIWGITTCMHINFQLMLEISYHNNIGQISNDIVVHQNIAQWHSMTA